MEREGKRVNKMLTFFVLVFQFPTSCRAGVMRRSTPLTVWISYRTRRSFARAHVLSINREVARHKGKERERRASEHITNKNNFVTGRRRVVRSIPFRLIPCKQCNRVC